MEQSIPIIDLFAGPGGLGEGFSACTFRGNRRFKIGLSIEKDAYAHKTLRLRAFFRQFPKAAATKDYYLRLEGKLNQEELFKKHPIQAAAADSEAWLAEMGSKDTPEKLIDKRINHVLKATDRWLLIGGPPCQAYSLVGRSKIIGGKGRLEYESDHRHFLYQHYLRIIAQHRPPVFVMENVKGLLSATLKGEGTFDRIVQDLASPLRAVSVNTDNFTGSKKELHYRLFPLTVPSKQDATYDPKDYLIRSEDFGVPQCRHRVIILGIRSDLPLPRKHMVRQTAVSVEEAIADLPPLRSALSKAVDTSASWLAAVKSVMQDRFGVQKLQQRLRICMETELRNMRHELGRGDEFIATAIVHDSTGLGAWYRDPRLKGICNHATRSHMAEDLARYFFVSCFGKELGRSPVLADFPAGLLPQHKNVLLAGEDSPVFSDRFRVQVASRPATTITSHISKDGHYFIHPDPSQCRSLTVREAARLQTFPDNYFFEGPRTQQYHQVGNAVPPYLAHQIAGIVSDTFDCWGG